MPEAVENEGGLRIFQGRFETFPKTLITIQQKKNVKSEVTYFSYKYTVLKVNCGLGLRDTDLICLNIQSRYQQRWHHVGNLPLVTVTESLQPLELYACNGTECNT